jgi:hypothetical protein
LGGNRNQTTEDLIPYLDVVAAIAMISFLWLEKIEY